MPPPWFLVHRGVGDTAHGADETAIGANYVGGKLCPWRFVHKGHELIREPWHGASDADAAHVGAAANAAHPATLGYVAIHHRSPAAQLHQAFGRSVVSGKVALLIVRTAIATLVHRLAEQPGRPQLLVQRNHGSQSSHLV